MPVTLHFDDLFEPAEVRALTDVIAYASSPAEAIATWRQQKESVS